MLQDRDVLEGAAGDEVGEELPGGVVGEEREVELVGVVKELPELVVRAGGDEARDDGADGGAREDPREVPFVEERLDDAEVEGPEGAAAAQDERGAAKGVAGLPEERELLLGGELGALVGRDGPEARVDLVDVAPDGPRDHRAALVELAARHVAEVADEVGPEAEHHAVDVPRGPDLLQVAPVRLEEPRVVEPSLLPPELLEALPGHRRHVEVVQGPGGLGPVLVRGARGQEPREAALLALDGAPGLEPPLRCPLHKRRPDGRGGSHVPPAYHPQVVAHVPEGAACAGSVELPREPQHHPPQGRHDLLQGAPDVPVDGQHAPEGAQEPP